MRNKPCINLAIGQANPGSTSSEGLHRTEPGGPGPRCRSVHPSLRGFNFQSHLWTTGLWDKFCHGWGGSCSKGTIRAFFFVDQKPARRKWGRKKSGRNLDPLFCLFFETGTGKCRFFHFYIFFAGRTCTSSLRLWLVSVNKIYHAHFYTTKQAHQSSIRIFLRGNQVHLKNIYVNKKAVAIFRGSE